MKKMWCEDDGTVLREKQISVEVSKGKHATELRQYCPRCQRIYGRVNVRKIK